MTTLRDAAQALQDRLFGIAGYDKERNALALALAAPPEPDPESWVCTLAVNGTTCGGLIGPDVTGRPMCYRCGPAEMRPYPFKAAPPEPGWAEGWRAGIEAAAQDMLSGLGLSYMEDIESVRALPPPSAPTQAPEARHCSDPDCRRELPATWFNSLCAICSGWDRSTAQYRQAAAAPVGPEVPCPVPNCFGGMLRDHNGRDSVSCPVCDGTITAAAYRSLEKTHGIVVRRPAPEAKTAKSVVGYVWADAWRRGVVPCVLDRPSIIYENVRVRVTVDPAPVEPEETP